MMASKKRAHLVIDQSVTGWRRTIGLIGSLLLWSGPPLLMLAWYREPWLSEFARPFARPAIYGALAGTGLIALARLSPPRPQSS